MRPRNLWIPILAASCLIAQGNAAQENEAEPKQPAQVAKTERMDFPAGGLLRLKNSIGEIDIEAWDNPNMEITTIKSTKEKYSAREREKATAKLTEVSVAAERHGDEVVIITNFSTYRGLPPPSPLSGPTNFDLEYHIRLPRNARLGIEHNSGNLNVDGVTGDIEAKLLQGEMMLHLPEDALYSIDAKSDLGSINSDFPGTEKRRRWLLGHSVVREVPRPAHTLHLRVGVGDIVILKTRIPKMPEPTAPLPARSGL